MAVTRFVDADLFAAAIDSLVQAHPIRTQYLRTFPWPGESVEGWVVGDGSTTGIAGAGIMMHGGVHLAPLAESAVAPLAGALPAGAVKLRGTPDDVSAVAGHYSELHGGAIHPTGFARIYVFDPETDISLRPVVGEARMARSDEYDMVFDWALKMVIELGEQPDSSAFRAAVKRRFDHRQYWFWQVDGERVAQLFRSRDATGIVRIGGVYTPDDRRGRGYAAALTSAVSRHLVEQGFGVALHTDASNALTNRLYRRIGFRSHTELLHVEVS